MSRPRKGASAHVKGFNTSLAILTGIDRYGGGVPMLRTPVSDATELGVILERDHGFQTEVITDEDATLDKLRDLFADLDKGVGPDDRVLFYHGIALGSDEGPKGYLLPQDVTRDSTDRYLSMVEFNEALSALPCRHMLVVPALREPSAGRAHAISLLRRRSCIRSATPGSSAMRLAKRLPPLRTTRRRLILRSARLWASAVRMKVIPICQSVDGWTGRSRRPAAGPVGLPASDLALAPRFENRNL
jgi:hypothetical protein